MSRVLLACPTTFTCDQTTTPQSILTMLQSQYDLGGQTVTIDCKAIPSPGIYLSGQIVGQAGASGLIIANGVFETNDGSYAVGLAYGAGLTLYSCVGNTNGLQDVINVGGGSRLVMTGNNSLYQEVIGGKNAFNHISVYINSSLSIYGNLSFYGASLFGIDSTTNSYVAAECNTTHGSVSFSAMDTPSHPTGPYFYGSFVDAAGGFINLAGVDFKNPAYGYRYTIRWGGTLFVNQAGDPGQLERMFGTAMTREPVGGTLE